MEHKQNERWKDVIGYEGIYQISNCGNVRSLKFGIKSKSISIKDNGYCRITFNKDKKQKDFYVHRLVATAFIENPTNKKEMNKEEINKTMNFLIRTTVRTLGVKWSEAEYRVKALFKSGMLDDIKFNPENLLHQKAITLFLQVPREKYEPKDKSLLDKTSAMVKDAILDAMRESGEVIVEQKTNPQTNE